jgi:hypothetical protein
MVTYRCTFRYIGIFQVHWHMATRLAHSSTNCSLMILMVMTIQMMKAQKECANSSKVQWLGIEPKSASWEDDFSTSKPQMSLNRLKRISVKCERWPWSLFHFCKCTGSRTMGRRVTKFSKHKQGQGEKLWGRGLWRERPVTNVHAFPPFSEPKLAEMCIINCQHPTINMHVPKGHKSPFPTADSSSTLNVS